MTGFEFSPKSGGYDNPAASTRRHLEWNLPEGCDVSDIFISLTKGLQKRFAINRGVLMIKGKSATRFMAVSTFNNGKTRRNLSLRMPTVSSLFEKVAEDGRVYTEDFCDLFSGNSFERHLLLDDDTRSFVVHPLKHDGEVVGLLGYSSDQPTAFTLFEEGVLSDLASRIARRIAECPTGHEA